MSNGGKEGGCKPSTGKSKFGRENIFFYFPFPWVSGLKNNSSCPENRQNVGQGMLFRQK